MGRIYYAFLLPDGVQSERSRVFSFALKFCLIAIHKIKKIKSEDLIMKKYKIEITKKNGNKKTVAVYLDETTAALLESTGDKNLLRAYLIEEYKTSCRERQEEFWCRSLDEDYENGIDPIDETVDVEDELEKQEESNALQKAIARLEPQQRWLVEQIYFLGRTQVEISDELGVSEVAVSLRLKKIYAKLKKILGKGA